MKKKENNIYDNPNNWHWFIYKNPNDPRVIVPKRNKYMGWTFNFGHPKGKWITWGFIALIVATIGFVAYAGARDFEYSFDGSSFHIDAAMYDYAIERNQVASVTLINDAPTGRRTNGYGGIRKAYGHFSLKDYGKSRLYANRDVDMYIVVQLQGDSPSYVIFNEKTLEKTEALYEDIQGWLRGK